MGYYTNHSLEVQPWSDSLIEQLRKENENAAYAFDDSGDTNEGCKWYDHTKELIEFSKKYPNHILILSGEGEEPTDQWKHYFKNGQDQLITAKITFEDPTDPFLQTQEQTDAANEDERNLIIQQAEDAKAEVEREKRRRINELQDEIDRLKSE